MKTLMNKNLISLACVVILLIIVALPKKGESAVGICPCAVPLAYATATLHPGTDAHITAGFLSFQQWLTNVFWEQHLLPALQAQTAQIATVTKQQEAQIARFYDGKHEKEVARRIQTARAQTHTEFNTSKQLCKTATQSRSLNASEQNGKLATAALVGRVNQRAQIRGDVISGSQNTDTLSRLNHYKTTYANQYDNGMGLGNLASGSVPVDRRNRDINVYQTLFEPNTLELDFSDGTTTEDEEDAMAIMANLFPTTAMQIPEAYLVDGSGNVKPEAASLVTKRRRAFLCTDVAAMAFAKGFEDKAQGAPEVADNFHAQKEEEGIDRAKSEELYGTRPSLNAQEQNLARMYENPSEQIALSGEGSANLARGDIAKQGLEMKTMYGELERIAMQEMMTICEFSFALEKERDRLNNEINSLRQNGTTL